MISWLGGTIRGAGRHDKLIGHQSVGLRASVCEGELGPRHLYVRLRVHALPASLKPTCDGSGNTLVRHTCRPF